MQNSHCPKKQFVLKRKFIDFCLASSPILMFPLQSLQRMQKLIVNHNHQCRVPSYSLMHLERRHNPVNNLVAVELWWGSVSVAKEEAKEEANEEEKEGVGNPRIILISTLSADVVFIIHVLSVLLCVTVGLLAVDEVYTLGLSQLLNLSNCKTGEKLLDELVRDLLAYYTISDHIL
jgi:hypothetical protein